MENINTNVNLNKIEQLLEKLFDFGIQLVIAILILFVGFKLIKILEKSLKKHRKLDKLDPSVKGFLVSILSLSLKVLLFVVAASVVGIPTTSFITIIGSCGLAVGLALQGGLSNLAGGVMILMFKPFEVGDYINALNMEGTVKSITMFYTSLTTPDNKVVQLPNGILSNSTITNFTANPIRRLDLEFQASYDDKIDKVKKVINEVLDNCEYVLEDKTRLVNVVKHGDSSVVYIVQVWVKKENYLPAKYNLNEAVKEAFDKNKIEIPYMQIDIRNR